MIADILGIDGFVNIQPIHPMGGLTRSETYGAGSPRPAHAFGGSDPRSTLGS